MLVYTDSQNKLEVHLEPTREGWDTFCLRMGKDGQLINLEALLSMWYLTEKHSPCFLVLDDHPTCKSSFFQDRMNAHEWNLLTQSRVEDAGNTVRTTLHFKLHCNHVIKMTEFALNHLLPPSYEVPSNVR